MLKIDRPYIFFQALHFGPSIICFEFFLEHQLSQYFFWLDFYTEKELALNQIHFLEIRKNYLSEENIGLSVYRPIFSWFNANSFSINLYPHFFLQHLISTKWRLSGPKFLNLHTIFFIISSVHNYKSLGPEKSSSVSFLYFLKSSTQYLMSCCTNKCG